MMAATASVSRDLRRAFAERLRDEELTDYQLARLKRWIDRMSDDRVAEGIELMTIALDAPRKGRHISFWLIDNKLRYDKLAHEESVAFLRWAVKGSATQAKIVAKLGELCKLKTAKERAAYLAELEGSATNTASLARAHSILAHAWRAAPPNARPSGEVHRGEVEPFIGARGTIRAAIFIARQVEHLMKDAKAKKAYRRLLDLAEASVKAGKASAALQAALATPPPVGVLPTARSACVEARAALGRPDNAGAATRPAAVKAVGLLLKAEGPDSVGRFLSGLDDELRRLDIEHALFQREKTPSKPIARAIYRGAAAGAKDPKIVVWLALLADNKTYGLLSKQGRFWTWTEAGRDEVLATVPDDHFEQAAMAAKH